MTASDRCWLEEISALRIFSIIPLARQTFREDAYSSSWCRTSAGGFHVAAVGEVFFIVAFLGKVSLRSLASRVGQILSNSTSCIWNLSIWTSFFDSPVGHPWPSTDIELSRHRTCIAL